MPARRAHKAAGRVRLQPPLAFSAIPDAVLGSEHPSPTFAIEHCEVAHREPERARLQTAVAAFLDKEPIASFGVGKRIDGHAQSIAGWPVASQGIRFGPVWNPLSRARVRD